MIIKNVSMLGYPKTGNTWLHHILVLAFEADWNGLYATHGMPGYNDEPYSKTRFDFEGHFLFPKTVIPLRHLGDVLVSLYMHNVYRENRPLYRGTIDEMVFDPVYGAMKYVVFHQALAERINRAASEVKFAWYEKMIRDDAFLEEIIRFSGVEDLSKIEHAIHASRFDNMKKMEVCNAYSQISTLARSKHWLKTNNSFKVREGKSGEYIHYFNDQSISFIDECMRQIPEMFGYQDIVNL